MTLTANQQITDDLYRELFPHRANPDGTGGGASFGTLGGADYWVDQLDAGTLDAAGLRGHLTGSQEYQNQTLGGVDPSKSMAANAAAGNNWAGHFVPGGSLSAGTDLTGTIWEGMGAGASSNQGTDDAASALNNIAAATNTPINNLGGAYYNQGINAQGFTDDGTAIDNNAVVTNTGDGSNQIDTSQFLTQQGLTDWWDALDKSAFSGNQSSTGGVDDFMKFMMFMSMMRPQGGMGGGSQYGYGGLNPGGVQSAYNPMDNITNMMSAFNSLPGIGTNLTNTGAAAAA